MDLLRNLEEELEAKAIPTSESEQLLVRDLGKEERWLKKRTAKITSSTLPNLMKGGRAKGQEWGETAKDVLYGVKYERRTGLMRETKDFIKNFIFGKEHEPAAFEWLKLNGYPDIKNSDDFDDIIFHEPFEGFGDSPDFKGEKLVGEIKCNVSQEKYEKLLDEKVIHDKSEYYWQLLGHFIGMPEAETLVYCMYDAYNNEGHVIKMQRKDHLANIEKLEQRIKDANRVVDAALRGETKISQINEFLNG
jgi:hypothetical protein